MRFVVLTLAISCFTGCSTLEGEWGGKMKCETGGNWEADFTIEKNQFEETVFDGLIAGAVPCTADGDEIIACNFLMEGYIRQSKPSGEQRLDVDIDRCEADGGENGSIGFGCEDPYKSQWDGRNEIEMFHETSGDVACKIELERQ